jgi:hypothetical protein
MSKDATSQIPDVKIEDIHWQTVINVKVRVSLDRWGDGDVTLNLGAVI